MTTRQRYLLTFTPPAPLYAEIDSIRKYVANTYKCYKATKPPVHITLINPFELFTDKEAVLISTLQAFAIQRTPFRLELKDYGFFPKNRQPVAFVNVVDHPEFPLLTRALASHLKTTFPELMHEINGTHKPHITIAYRDTTAIFPALMDEFSKRSFEASFEADHIVLYRWEGRWTLVHEFPFVA